MKLFQMNPKVEWGDLDVFYNLGKWVVALFKEKVKITLVDDSRGDLNERIRDFSIMERKITDETRLALTIGGVSLTCSCAEAKRFLEENLYLPSGYENVIRTIEDEEHPMRKSSESPVRT